MDDEDMLKTVNELPDFVNQFTSSLSKQANDEKRYHLHLQNLQTLLKQLKLDEIEANENILQTKREIDIVLCDARDTTLTVNKINGDIDKELQKQKEIKQEIYINTFKKEDLERKFCVLHNKINAYEERIDASCKETLQQEFKKIEELEYQMQTVIDQITYYKDHLFSNESDFHSSDEISGVNDNIQHINNQIQEGQKEHQRLQIELTVSRKEVNHIQQEIDVLQKRNNAQLIRLQRQVEELQSSMPDSVVQSKESKRRLCVVQSVSENLDNNNNTNRPF